jgi:hypothetical protein
MRNKFFLLVLIISVSVTNIYSQDSISLTVNDNSSNKLTLGFGELTSGEISIKDHLSDSLVFTNPKFNSMLHVNSFHISITCNNQIIKSIENKAGNKLTEEMKAALIKFHPGCTITFGSIKLISTRRDVHENYNTLDYGSSLKFILK